MVRTDLHMHISMHMPLWRLHVCIYIFLHMLRVPPTRGQQHRGCSPAR